MAGGREGNQDGEVSLTLMKESISRGQQWPTELKNTQEKGQHKGLLDMEKSMVWYICHWILGK